MRVSMLVLLLVLGSIPLTGFAHPEPQDEIRELLKERSPLETDAAVDLVEFKGECVSIKYPAGWEVLPDVRKPRVLHVKTLGGKVNVSITVQNLAEQTTLEQYRESTMRDIEADAKDLQPKKVSEEKTHLGDMTAWKLVYSISVPNIQPATSAKQTLFIAVQGSRGYLLCCTAFDALPSKFDGVFRTMADSLKAN